MHAGLLGALESQAVEEAPMQGGPAAAAQPAYEPPAESALLADGLIEPVRASPMDVSLSETRLCA